MRKIPDEVDRAIVALLQTDGRMSCSKIARSLGCVTARTVSNRIRRLTKTGIIRVSAVPNPRVLGYAIAADIAITVAPGNGKVRQVAEAIRELPEVSYVAITAGDRDVNIQVNAIGVPHLQRFITETLQGIEGVQRTTTGLLTEVLEDIYEWKIPEELPP